MADNIETLINSCGFITRDGPYGSVRPIYIGHSKCAKGHIYGPFRRKHFVFQFILSGEGSFESPYGSYTPKENDMLVMHRGDLVDYGCYTDNPWSSIWIEFDCTEKLPKVFNTGVIHNEKLRDVFTELLTVKKLEHGHNAMATSLIWKIISILDTDNPTPKYYSQYINDALTFIHRHYIQKISVNEIAKSINLNRSYFCSLFKKEVGCSPKEYIDNYRISASCEILKQSTLSVGEVAEKAGYSDLAAFSKAFKLKIGVAPTAYRELNKK